MDKKTLRMQMLSGIITESEYKAKLNENETAEKLFQVFKDEGLLNDRREYDAEDFMLAYPDLSQEEAEKLEKMLQNPANLNEHYIAGGIVGIGAINQIPSRVKADYEDAFEYFLSQKYSLNEMEDLEEYAETQPIDIPQGMSDLPDNVKKDPNFEELVDYFKTHKSEAKKVINNVKDELSSLKEAYKDKDKYYIEDAYGREKEATKKEYLRDKLLAIGLPAAALGFVGALMAGPLGAMDPGSILQAIGIAAGIGGAAGAALDYGKPTSISETEVDESDLYENVDEEVKQKIMQMVDNAKFEYSQKGNDLIFAVTKALLTSDGQEIFKTQMKQKLKQENNAFDYYGTDKEALNAFFNDGMEEGKEVEEPRNY
jgi:hypothetical protein